MTTITIADEEARRSAAVARAWRAGRHVADTLAAYDIPRTVEVHSDLMPSGAVWLTCHLTLGELCRMAADPARRGDLRAHASGQLRLTDWLGTACAIDYLHVAERAS